MSTTSEDVYDDSKSSDNECVVQSFTGDDILILAVYSLHQAAKYISNVIADKDEQRWHLVSLWCFHYVVILLNPPFAGGIGEKFLEQAREAGRRAILCHAPWPPAIDRRRRDILALG
jgi:hypothetical protein